MSNANDFVIENNILVKYTGTDEDVIIPEGVTQIGDYAFRRNETVKSVIIPDGVESIGRVAFYECKSLKKITIPNSVKIIGEYEYAVASHESAHYVYRADLLPTVS